MNSRQAESSFMKAVDDMIVYFDQETSLIRQILSRPFPVI